MSTPSSVLVGRVNRTVWVKVEGRGNFQNSSGLKEFVKQMIQRGSREFVVDLQACEVMDSTFMGTLAGVALRLREIGQGTLRVVNANERNGGLLSSLGLDQLFAVEGPGSVIPVEEPAPNVLHEAQATETDAAAQKQTVLDAHEALAEADADNAVKFKDVLDYLRQELNDPSSDKAL